jgi:hypothetical protein
MKLSQQRRTFRETFATTLTAYEGAIKSMFDENEDREAQFTLHHELFVMVNLAQTLDIITATDAARYKEDIRLATAKANAQLMLDLSDTQAAH